MIDNLIEEIRINPRYTQHVKSEFPDGALREESVPIVRKSVSDTQDYLRKISSGLNHHTGILPPNCRFIEKLTNGHLVVIEEPPAYRTIKVSYSMQRELDILEQDNKLEEWGIKRSEYSGSNAPFNFTLAFPYVIFILMFDRYNGLMAGSVYLRNARLAGYSDYLLKMPMMNINSEQYVCFGDKGSQRQQSLNAAIEHAIMVWWSASFNADYTYNYSAYKEVAGVNTYIGWQAMSQIDPMFIYNVEWIKMDRNLNDTIIKMKQHCDGRSKSTISYDELQRVFTQPSDSGRDEKIKRTSRSKRTSRLFYDISQGIYLNDQFFLHVGDPIMWGKHHAHISSFVGFFESDKIRLIQIQLDNGKKVEVRYNKKVQDYLYATAKQMRFEAEGTLKNGVKIKEEDIIIMKSKTGSDIYRKVHFIRKAQDGLTEARLGNAFYLLENTEGSLFNVEEPEYRGIKMKKGDKFIIINSPNAIPHHNGREVTYDGMNVSRMGSLRFDFNSTDTRHRGNTHSISMDESRSSTNYRRLFTLDECKPLPPVYRIGRKLMCLKYNDRVSDGVAWATPEGVAYDGNYSISSPTIAEVEKNVLFDSGTRFSLESFDIDIEFKIGDKVIQADWKNPINMLIPRTITAFTIDADRQSLNVVLQDKEGRLSQVTYIEGNAPGSSRNRAGIVNIGRIRKISNTWGRVTAGTKIMAKKGYIPHFPKKDTNIIIGFITDTGGDDPLVLCSNCCTLWYSEMMENFKRITIKSKKWATLAHAPIDITKIKIQPGDIVNGDTDYRTNCGWLVVRTRSQITPKITSLSNYTSHGDTYSVDAYTRSHVMLDCIPNPRISPTEQSKSKIVPAWPNFHGLFFESKLSHFSFLDDGRSLLHVSDPH